MTEQGITARLRAMANAEHAEAGLETLRRLVLFVEREAHLLGKDVEAQTTALIDKLY